MRAVFTLITFIFIICVSMTITSFAEVPLWMLESNVVRPFTDDPDAVVTEEKSSDVHKSSSDSTGHLKADTSTSYGALESTLELPSPNHECAVSLPFLCNIQPSKYFRVSFILLPFSRVHNEEIRCLH